MGHVGVLEAADDLDERIHLPDVLEEGVPQAFALAGAPHQARNIHELLGSVHDAGRIHDLGQLAQAGIRHVHHAGGRTGRAEQEIARSSVPLRHRIEKHRLANTGQADDATLDRHRILQTNVPVSQRRPEGQGGFRAP